MTNYISNSMDSYLFSYIDLASKFGAYLLFITSAFAHDIRILFFLMKTTISDYKGESIVHQTSIATIIKACITID